MKAAWCDFKGSLFKPSLFLRLGWDDVRHRYVRTFLGPLWLIIGTAIWIAAMGFVMSALFGQPLAKTLAFIADGVLVWTFIANSMSDGTTLFVLNAHLIQSVRVPLSFHILRMVFRNFIIFLHNFIIIILVIVIFHVPVNFYTLMLIPSLFILLLNAIWVGTLLGMLNARFRDIQQIVNTSMAVLPFMTPIFWERKFLVTRPWIADINPFYHMINIVRSPLLGEPVALLSWIVSLGITLVGCVLTLLIFSKFKHRIIYWL